MYGPGRGHGDGPGIDMFACVGKGRQQHMTIRSECMTHDAYTIICRTQMQFVAISYHFQWFELVLIVRLSSHEKLMA